MTNITDEKQVLLAIDVGNTNVVLGIFRGAELTNNWRLATSVSRTSDEAWIIFSSLCKSQDVDIGEVAGVVIGSVVPDLTTIFTELAQNYLNIEPYEVRSDTAPSLKIHYKDPSAVGADRICNAVAGFEKHGGPLIVVDFGTATTFDVVNKDGEYLGGVITPGIELAQKILHERAARLPKVQLDFPDRVIGNTTVSSIQSGLLFGAVESLEGVCRRIWKELGCTGKVIATGGLSTLIAGQCKMIDTVEPNLVLDGLQILFSRHHSG